MEFSERGEEHHPTDSAALNPVQKVIRSDGSADPDTDPGLTTAQVTAIYKAMLRTRVIDERLVKLQRQGRIAFHVGCLGEEAAVIGSAAALGAQDWIVPCYRELGALLWRGYLLQTYIDHMFGNADDPTKGRQMPDHTVSRELKYLSVSAPIGTQIPHAVGLAWAAKHKGTDEVAAVYFGDGATSSNDFHGAMNFAGVFRTPTVFLCRNNGWAISLPSEMQTASKTLADKGIAYGVPSARVDGNDALATYKVVHEAVERARRGLGPTLVELLTYRVGGHSTSDDPTIYRAEEEVDAWRQGDPLLRLRQHLSHKSAWDDAQDEAWRAAVEAELRECIAAAEQKPDPPLESVFTEVYRDQPWHLREQQEACVDGPRVKKGHDD